MGWFFLLYGILDIIEVARIIKVRIILEYCIWKWQLKEINVQIRKSFFQIHATNVIAFLSCFHYH